MLQNLHIFESKAHEKILFMTCANVAFTSKNYYFNLLESALIV